jgi:hypothetical protein
MLSMRRNLDVYKDPYVYKEYKNSKRSVKYTRKASKRPTDKLYSIKEESPNNDESPKIISIARNKEKHNMTRKASPLPTKPKSKSPKTNKTRKGKISDFVKKMFGI